MLTKNRDFQDYYPKQIQQVLGVGPGICDIFFKLSVGTPPSTRPRCCLLPSGSKIFSREFPDGPVVRTWHFHYQGPGSIPGRGTKILQATQPNKKNHFQILKQRLDDVGSSVQYDSEK